MFSQKIPLGTQGSRFVFASLNTSDRAPAFPLLEQYRRFRHRTPPGTTMRRLVAASLKISDQCRSFPMPSIAYAHLPTFHLYPNKRGPPFSLRSSRSSSRLVFFFQPRFLRHDSSLPTFFRLKHFPDMKQLNPRFADNGGTTITADPYNLVPTIFCRRPSFANRMTVYFGTLRLRLATRWLKHDWPT